MRDSLMYKMTYHRYGDIFGPHGIGQDRVRGVQVRSAAELETLEEAYSTQHFIVRLFKVKKPDNLGRPLIKSAQGDSSSRKRKPGERK